MNFMELCPEKASKKIDALAKSFLKECGYKITNFNDVRQCNRLLNRLNRNNKELTYKQYTENQMDVYFWFQLIEKDKDENVLKESKKIHFKFNQLDIVPDSEVESFDVNPQALSKALNGGV